MKFWQKTFLLTLFLFLIIFDSSMFLLANSAFTNSLNNEKERSLGEQYFISNAIAKDLSAIKARGSDTDMALRSLFSAYTSYYKDQQVYLELLKNGKALYSNIPGYDGTKPELSVDAGFRNTVLRTVEHHKYFYVAGYLPNPCDEYVLVYAHDISKLTASQAQLTRFLTTVSIFISLLLTGALYLLLRRLTKPIAQLSLAAQRISDGELNERAMVIGRDEFSELAVNFNGMAEKVQGQIKALEVAAEQKQQFIDNLAHELRTPLTTIYGFAEYIQRASITDDDRITATQYILSESKRLQQIAFKLLDLALLRHSEIDLTEVRVDNLFEKSMNTIRQKADQKQIAIEVDVRISSVKGDAALLESLIINLLDNAVKACSLKGKIGLNAYADGNEKILEIKDNGCGMTKEQIAHITEPFYRVDKSRSRAQGGAGLGLSLCEQISRFSCAVLEFVSESGKGTSVKVRFTTS
ncbi:HAMP domain-containing sensor histidine kinase [Desulfosporosinus sp. FKA]|uniref:sensor histidine kinase n=1 Tax=Desulfosporosinus sp. FKA TaxID=1969834 RepID=UPI000B498363|nr:HAMP domain-containing sensor histidine kinase [Desulfosporosinus sp. FKA]